MKKEDDEWGAVAYLSQSKYGKHGNTDYTGRYEEIYQNKSSTYITGSSNGTPSQSEYATKQYAYNNMTELGDGKGRAGPGASIQVVLMALFIVHMGLASF